MTEKKDTDELLYELQELTGKRIDDLLQELSKGEDFNLETLMGNDEAHNQNIKNLLNQMDEVLPRKQGTTKRTIIIKNNTGVIDTIEVDENEILSIGGYEVSVSQFSQIDSKSEQQMKDREDMSKMFMMKKPSPY